MTLVRYSPYRGMLNSPEFDRLLGGFFGGNSGVGAAAWSPVADVRETEAEFIVRLEVPGVDPSALSINIVNNTLTIKGEKKQENEETKGNWHHLERTWGSFERRFAFPSTVSADKIRARTTNGVLEITVPKAEEARPREIRIES